MVETLFFLIYIHALCDAKLNVLYVYGLERKAKFVAYSLFSIFRVLFLSNEINSIILLNSYKKFCALFFINII